MSSHSSDPWALDEEKVCDGKSSIDSGRSDQYDTSLEEVIAAEEGLVMEESQASSAPHRIKSWMEAISRINFRRLFLLGAAGLALTMLAIFLFMLCTTAIYGLYNLSLMWFCQFLGVGCSGLWPLDEVHPVSDVVNRYGYELNSKQ